MVQIIPPIRLRANRNIGCVKTHATLGIKRVIGFFINNTLVSPVAQIIYRRRPANVIVHAEYIAVKFIVRTVNINPAVKDIRLTIRDVFP